MKIKFKPKENRKILINAIVFFALLKPDSLEYLGLNWLDTLLVICDGFLLAYLVFNLILRRYKLSIISICIVFLYMAMALSTVIISRDYLTLLKTAGPAIAICMFTDMCMQKRPGEYLKTITLLLGVLYLANFITIVLYYPEGMYQTEYVIGDTYLMGFDNGMIYNFLPLCCYSLIYSYVTTAKMFTKLSISMIALMVVSEFYVLAGTGIIQALLFILLIIFVNKEWCSCMIKPFWMFGAFYVGTILLTVLRVQNYMANFIVGVLGKDLTLTGRTYLWDYAISVIKENPIIGIGAGGRTVLGINGHVYTHPHCMLLDFLYKGGIIMLVFFIMLTIVFTYKYFKSDSMVIRNIILVTLFVFLVGEMVNSTQYKVFFWAIFVLIGYVQNIESISDLHTNDKKGWRIVI